MKAGSVERANAKLRKLVRDVHERVDAHHAKPAQSPPGVRCTEGCAYAPAGCCSLITLLEASEAEYIVDRNREAVRRALPALLDAEQRIAEILAPDAITSMWRNRDTEQQVAQAYHEAHIVCPFLGSDRRCSIYRDRPVACRTHFVLSPPAECTAAGPSMKHVILDKGTRIAAQELIVRGVGYLRGELLFGTLPQLVLRAWRNKRGT